MIEKIKSKKNTILFIYIALFFIINFFSLDHYPFVHSDEPWLSGLSRNIMDSESFKVTETFFNTYPRYPHGIKILFHIIQIIFMKFFGYNIVTFRSISLIFGSLSLFFFYKTLDKIQENSWINLLMTILFSISIDFIYTSHVARQEIILVFSLILSINIIVSNIGKKSPWLIIGLILGLSVGIHPNSFIIALMIGSAYLIYVIKGDYDFSSLVKMVVLTFLIAMTFVGVSFILDSDFINHYKNFGSSLGVTESSGGKLETLPLFFYKMFKQISATYYIPDRRFFFLLLGSALPISLLTRKETHSLALLASVIGYITGILIIGRYNPTSIVFIAPSLYLLLAILIHKIPRKIAVALLVAGIVLSGITIVKDTEKYPDYSYTDYIKELDRFIPEDGATLGNLNTEYHFKNGKLLDYRNLAELKNQGISISDYIKTNKINYIILTDELDYLYRNERWQILYGDMDYYPELIDYVSKNCTLVGSFDGRNYGMRIVSYSFEGEWNLYIYKSNK